VYRQGYLHLITTRDGNNCILPLAWALCETESGDTYKWFAEQCFLAGLGRYLTKQSVLFTDRMKGIQEFYARFACYEAHCFKHIVDNCRKHIKGRRQHFENVTAWALRNANTKEEYLRQLMLLRAQSRAAADYFDALKHEQVFQYALNENKVATHGFKTSQIVECLNGVFVEARHHTPYRLNDMILAWIGKRLQEKRLQIIKYMGDGHFLTPYCAKLFQIQVCTNGPTRAHTFTLH